MQPTDEQALIVERAIAGHPLLIEALAGTGKPSTQVMIANAMPNRYGTYLAFNKSIANDAGRKFNSNQVVSSTVHSRAFQAVGIQYRHRLEGGQEGGRLTPLRLLQHYHYSGQSGISSLSRAGLVKQTLTNFLSTMQPEPTARNVPLEDLEQLSSLRAWQPSDIQAFAEMLAEDAKILWQDMQAPDSKLPMLHDGYLWLWAQSKPKLPGDFVLLDEAQDASEVIKQIVLSQDAQPVIVGDQRQQIYGWRGAINLMEELDWEKNFLSQSFRFGDHIAGAANLVLDHLGSPIKMRGFEMDRSQLPATRAMLYRTNAGVFGELIERSLKREQRVHVVGGTGDMYQMLNAVEALKKGRQTAHPDFIGFSSWPEYAEASEAYNAPHEMRLLVKIVNKYPMEQLKQAVGSAKGIEEESAHISLLTAHKGKGREWGHVALGKDFSLPEKNPLLDTDDNTIGTEEARLQYVALTRAQINLYGCKEMIGTYRERAKINEQLLAVADKPLEERLGVKMKFAPSVRDDEKFKAFYDNLETDEQGALSAKIEHLYHQKMDKEVKSLDRDIAR